MASTNAENEIEKYDVRLKNAVLAMEKGMKEVESNGEEDRDSIKDSILLLQGRVRVRVRVSVRVRVRVRVMVRLVRLNLLHAYIALYCRLVSMPSSWTLSVMYSTVALPSLLTNTPFDRTIGVRG